MNDKKLVRACKRKDKKAQKVLYEKYYDQMFRLCHRYLGNVHDAEDIVVEGFLRIFNKIETVEYRHENSFVNWMKTIMINESLMLLRRNKKIRFFEDDLIVEQESLVEKSLELQEILKAIACMPVGYRTIFNMYVIEGYSHKDIAKELEISEQTSKSQLSRAKKFCKTN
ncbi:MAG: sigma-70 family RNA polymerase sigma factor [Chloroflexia bacterium]|nr:sigma-70 family RNA polymerase sigma factor [Chloroflexia bacterium]